MIATHYLPHIIFGMALTSMSMNLVSQRRKTEDERYKIEAQISILESIKRELEYAMKDGGRIEKEKLERLQRLREASRLADGMGEDSTDADGDGIKGMFGLNEGERDSLKAAVGWGQVFRGKKPEEGEDDALSKWDKQDLEKIKEELSKQ